MKQLLGERVKLEAMTYESETLRITTAIHLLVVNDVEGTCIDETQRLVNEAHALVVELANEINLLRTSASTENIIATSRLLKLQTQLSIAVGTATKHVGACLRKKSLAIRSRTNIYLL